MTPLNTLSKTLSSWTILEEKVWGGFWIGGKVNQEHLLWVKWKDILNHCIPLWDDTLDQKRKYVLFLMVGLLDPFSPGRKAPDRQLSSTADQFLPWGKVYLFWFGAPGLPGRADLCTGTSKTTQKQSRRWLKIKQVSGRRNGKLLNKNTKVTSMHALKSSKLPLARQENHHRGVRLYSHTC